jgi:hypothetical protein
MKIETERERVRESTANHRRNFERDNLKSVELLGLLNSVTVSLCTSQLVEACKEGPNNLNKMHTVDESMRMASHTLSHTALSYNTNTQSRTWSDVKKGIFLSGLHSV